MLATEHWTAAVNHPHITLTKLNVIDTRLTANPACLIAEQKMSPAVSPGAFKTHELAWCEDDGMCDHL